MPCLRLRPARHARSLPGIKLRFFAGMTIPEAAQVLGSWRATVDGYWPYARAGLYCELKVSEVL